MGSACTKEGKGAVSVVPLENGESAATSSSTQCESAKSAVRDHGKDASAKTSAVRNPELPSAPAPAAINRNIQTMKVRKSGKHLSLSLSPNGPRRISQSMKVRTTKRKTDSIDEVVKDWLEPASLTEKKLALSTGRGGNPGGSLSRQKSASRSNAVISRYVSAESVEERENRVEQERMKNCLPRSQSFTTKKLEKRRDTKGNKHINQYMLYEKIGEGSFGQVRLCKNNETNECAAVKIMHRGKKQKLAQNNSSSNVWAHEIAIMKRVNHPNCVRLFEVVNSPAANKIYLFMEYVEGGSLLGDKDASPGRIYPINVVLLAARDVLLALDYLHKMRIVHGDIKPSNMLVSRNGDVKISDFGVAKVWGRSKSFAQVSYDITKAAGSPAFMAPELFGSEDAGKVSPPTADVWAFGVSFYLLAYGKLPFPLQSNFLDFEHTVKTKAVQYPDIDLAECEFVSPTAGDTTSNLRRLHEKNDDKRGRGVSDRVSANAAADSELLERMLEKAMVKPSDKRAIIPELMFDPWITCDGTMFLRQYPGIEVDYSSVLDTELKSAIRTDGTEMVKAKFKPIFQKLASKAREIVEEKKLKRCAPQARRGSVMGYRGSSSSLTAGEHVSVADVTQGGDSPGTSSSSDDESLNGAQDVMDDLDSDIFATAKKDGASKTEETSVFIAYDRLEGTHTFVSADQSVQFKVGTASSIGTRDSMEDEHCIDLDGPIPFIGIYDGHNGAECSAYLKENLGKVVLASDCTDGAIIDACHAVDASFLSSITLNGEDDASASTYAGSTANFAIVRSSRELAVANVGDSRSILVRQDGDVIAMSQDHKASDPGIIKQVESSGGWVANGRINGVLGVGRAFGDIEYKTLKEQSWKKTFHADVLSCKPDVVSVTLQNSDRFLVLACDGIFDVMTSAEVAQFVQKCLTKEPNLSNVASALVREAFEKNSIDNLSVIIVCFNVAE